MQMKTPHAAFFPTKASTWDFQVFFSFIGSSKGTYIYTAAGAKTNVLRFPENTSLVLRPDQSVESQIRSHVYLKSEKAT
jgi:hypothetical protein